MAFLRDSSVFCIPDSTYANQRKVVGGICIATSSIGFLGAVLQLKSLWKYRDRERRSPSADPRIIFYLALSDMFACIGVFALAACFTAVKPPKLKEGNPHVADVPPRTDGYEAVVTALEIIAMFSYLASYIWTFVFTLDMCFQVFKNKCPMIVYHIIAWFIPLELVVVIEGINFGQYPDRCELKYGQITRLILSYFLIILVIIGNSVLLCFTYKKIRQLSRSSGTFTSADRKALSKFKKKFFLMVFAFIICWLPNIYSVCYDLFQISSLSSQDQYIEKKSTLRLCFVYVEAILNPLQGMFNFFVYRKSFKVTATNTRLVGNNLPRVPRNFAYDNYVNTIARTRETVQTLTDSTSADEETALLGSARSTNSYTYVCRLLGE